MLVKKIYCIGHVDFSIEEFVSVLKNLNIKILVDIRADPDPDETDDFSQSVLREKLSTFDIVYHWAGRQFGERRESNKNSQHTQLHPKLMGFADYMQSSDFPRAIMQLTNLAGKGNTSLMCAKSRSVQSHCDLIADYLLLQGISMENVYSKEKVVEHTLSVSARRESAELIYDREINN